MFGYQKALFFSFKEASEKYNEKQFFLTVYAWKMHSCNFFDTISVAVGLYDSKQQKQSRYAEVTPHYVLLFE